MTRMPLLTAVAALGALVGCSVSPSTPSTVRSPQTGAGGVIRQVHSPGTVTDDMHLRSGECHQRDAADGEPLPDPSCTPGAVDPAVTPADIASTICHVGWTATVRPPETVTGRWKHIAEADYGELGVPGEYDHLVPLELGGANSTSNLWPEPGQIPNSKDKVENNLRAAVCTGKLTLHRAQAEIVTDWTTARW